MFEWHRLSPTVLPKIRPAKRKQCLFLFRKIVHKYLKGFVKKKIQNSLSFPFAANKMEKWKRAEVTKCGFGRDTYGMPASIKCQGGQKLKYLVELLCRLRLRSFLAAREATTPLLTDSRGPHRTLYRPLCMVWMRGKANWRCIPLRHAGCQKSRICSSEEAEALTAAVMPAFGCSKEGNGRNPLIQGPPAEPAEYTSFKNYQKKID